MVVVDAGVVVVVVVVVGSAVAVVVVFAAGEEAEAGRALGTVVDEANGHAFVERLLLSVEDDHASEAVGARHVNTSLAVAHRDSVSLSVAEGGEKHASQAALLPMETEVGGDELLAVEGGWDEEDVQPIALEKARDVWQDACLDSSASEEEEHASWVEVALEEEERVQHGEELRTTQRTVTVSFPAAISPTTTKTTPQLGLIESVWTAPIQVAEEGEQADRGFSREAAGGAPP